MSIRDYQQTATNAIWWQLNNNTGNCVVAMPTGTGKSHVISNTTKQIMAAHPTTRFMILVHVKELIQQNFNKLVEAWPQAPVGMYSAGLGVKQNMMPITFGGIASIINGIDEFGIIDILFIDECHLLNPNSAGMYMQVIAALLKKNPNLRVVGLTATPWRLGLGHIVDGQMFQHMAIDMTGMQAFNWFLTEGYLSRLVVRPTSSMFDLSGVGMSGGDLNQSDVEKIVNNDRTTYQALQEVLYYGQDRKRWLIFGSGVDHVERITAMLNYLGISATCVHRDIKKTERDQRLKDFAAGRYRAIVNFNVLTTGFDDPRIDLIAMLRATISPGLWVQMLGRGTRPLYELLGYPPSNLDTAAGRFWAMANGGKHDCLVLDFAGNAMRLGPINDPVMPKKKGEGTGDAPVKICETSRLVKGNGCGCYNHPSVRNCENCGAEFDFQIKYGIQSATMEVIAAIEPEYLWFNVDNTVYQVHQKAGSVPCFRVSYYAGYRRFDDWVFIEGKGLALHRAREWWRARAPGDVPTNAKLALVNSGLLKKPRRIRVHINHKPYPEILSYEYE